MSPAMQYKAPTVKHITCSGTPYEVGQQHGSQARDEVLGSIEFYKDFFMKRIKIDWTKAEEVATEFLPFLKSNYAEYVEEMQGVADGAGVKLNDVVLLNVRTEIAYGMMSDGCTAFAWKSPEGSFIAQNWDWSAEQIPNIIKMRIEQEGKPVIEMMTEGGILGKIGMNSAGVGVTLNAIQAKGLSYKKLPCHLALRTVLNSGSRKEAEEKVRNPGVASACHIQIADKDTGAVGFECTSEDIVELQMDSKGITTHSNHLIKPHKVGGKIFLTDSPDRLERIGELIGQVQKPSIETLAALLKDENKFPCAINRQQTEKSTIQTLFSIVMNLTEGYAKVKMGRPTEDGEELELRP